MKKIKNILDKVNKMLIFTRLRLCIKRYFDLCGKQSWRHLAANRYSTVFQEASVFRTDIYMDYLMLSVPVCFSQSFPIFLGTYRAKTEKPLSSQILIDDQRKIGTP